MVAEGHAWVYRIYSVDPEMLELEAKTQGQGVGLWTLPEAERVPPWDWRKSKRK
jgi:endonuclease YncB( thermonuclease family)